MPAVHIPNHSLDGYLDLSCLNRMDRDRHSMPESCTRTLVIGTLLDGQQTI
jgi:hypothetical protein